MPDKAPKRTPRARATGSSASDETAPPPVSSDDRGRLQDELRRVNQELSKIGQIPRPGSDAARQYLHPQKQDLLTRKAELERKIRALSNH